MSLGSKRAFGVLAITEIVFFSVRIPKDVITNTVQDENSSRLDGAKLDWVEDKIPSLKGVNEWNPKQVTDSKHKAKAIACDVHRCEKRRLNWI